MIRVDRALCNGCQVCVHACPYGVLAMRDRKAVVVLEGRCIECGACSKNCEKGAAIVTQGTGCVIHILKEDLARLRRRFAAA